MAIFRDEAPKYWAAGLPVIPLKAFNGDGKTGKQPFDLGWQKYAVQMPTDWQQEQWLSRTDQDFNMGLPLGPKSGLIALDIDTDDKKIQKAILDVLPDSPWVRKGKKGIVVLYKFNGERKKVINIEIPGSDDPRAGHLGELLGQGSQVVLPPSIHPETQKPYVCNVPLLEVHNQVNLLPPDWLERVNASLKAHGYIPKSFSNHTGPLWSVKVPKGQRDNKMIVAAGVQARAVIKGETTVKRAILDLQGWYEMNVEKDKGDQLDINKGLTRFVEFLSNDVRSGRGVLPVGWDEGLSKEEKEQMGLVFEEEHESWEAGRIRQYIEEEVAVAAAEGNRERVSRGVDLVLKKLAKNKDISATDLAVLLNEVKVASGLKINMSAFTKQLKELSKGPIEGLSHTEIAKDLLDNYIDRNGDLKFHEGQFWAWNGSHWHNVDRSVFLGIIASDYGDLPAAKKSGDHRGIVDILGTIATGSICTDHISGVNFSNGFLTPDLELLPHDKKYGMTYTMPFPYSPDRAHNTPLFNKYLYDSWGHQEGFDMKVMALQEALAASLFGVAPKYQRAFLLLGEPNSGKSQLLHVVSKMCPEEAVANINPYIWDDSQNSFPLAQLSGKVINICAELDEKKCLPSRVFKSVVSADTAISARHPHGQYFSFKPISSHWFASNHLPKTNDTTEGFSRRWLIFSFDRKVEEKDIIADFGERIVREEMDGIVAWAAEAMPRLATQEKYTRSPHMIADEEKLACKNNPVRSFLSESTELVFGPGQKVTEEKLYGAYFNYSMMQFDMQKKGTRAFVLEVKALARHFKIMVEEKDGSAVFIGVGLKK